MTKDMKKPLTILFLVLLVSFSDELTPEAPNEVPWYRMIVTNGLTFELDSNEPFTGVSIQHKNGQLAHRTTYKNGKKVGKEDYYENGQLKIRVNFKDGEQNGLAEQFHENGELAIRGNFKDGKQDGLWEGFHENGNLIDTEEYKDGVLQK